MLKTSENLEKPNTHYAYKGNTTCQDSYVVLTKVIYKSIRQQAINVDTKQGLNTELLEKARSTMRIKQY